MCFLVVTCFRINCIHTSSKHGLYLFYLSELEVKQMVTIALSLTLSASSYELASTLAHLL